MNQTLEPVITILQKEGATEDQIADTVADLVQAATALFYKEAMEVFSEEDIKKIDVCENENQANSVIRGLYEQKMSRKPEEEMDIFLKTFVETFLKEHAEINT